MPQNIHLIFKTHLDVGFTNFARVVIDQYFKTYIPSAIRLARLRHESGSPDRFIWTTGSWLIYEYLEQAGTVERREMESAIENGDIAWHGLPFTTHSELMDVDLFRLGLSISRRLDDRYGVKTIAAKFTDVPGHTRGIIPLLEEAGIQFLHIGVNGGSPVPKVPQLFRWQDGSGSEIIVLYEGGYGSSFLVPGLGEGLAFGHSIDNIGPQDNAAVDEIFRHLREENPGAQVIGSTLNAFAERLLPIRASLPIVTQEIGDSWIHGVGSDPVKVGQFRELLRMRREWIKSTPDIAADPSFDRFQRWLLLVPEHTWGMDEKTWLGDHEAYSAENFASARSQPNFQTFAASWAEQRAYLSAAVDSLGTGPRANESRSRLASIQPRQPATSWKPTESAAPLKYSYPWGSGEFDPVTGAIRGLSVLSQNQPLVSDRHPLGLLRFQTFSSEDYERFFHQYIRPEEQNNGWSREDFTKPGLEIAHPVGRFWQPRLDGWSQEGDRWAFHLAGEEEAVQSYGCPRDFYLEYVFNPEKPLISIELNWFHKKASRLPETLWFSFSPVPVFGSEWRIEKLGQWVDPLDVVVNGNRHLHASGEGIKRTDRTGQLRILSPDVPLVAPGEPSLLNFTNHQPDLAAGMHFNLYNNVWGTNFPMWLEDDCRFRFVLSYLTDEEADGV